MPQHTRLAIVNATHKGEQIEVNGQAVGGVGADGRSQYVVALHNSGGYYTCSCPAWKFQRGPRTQAKVCKHIIAYLAQRGGAKVEGGGLIRKDYFPKPQVQQVGISA